MMTMCSKGDIINKPLELCSVSVAEMAAKQRFEVLQV